MLRDVLLISSSGLVLFSKPFAGALSQVRVFVFPSCYLL